MLKEYRYRTNIFMKIFPVFWMGLVTYVYITAMFVFITESSFGYMIIYTVIMGFFIYLFWYFFKLYYLNIPVLSVTDEGIEYLSPTGIKFLTWNTITKIELKQALLIRFLLIQSNEFAPQSIKINKFDDTPENIVEFLTKIYNESKAK